MDHLDQLIQMALEEDVGSGDITAEATIPANATARARIRAKQDLILAGIEVARRVFALLDPNITFKPIRSDGDRCTSGTVIAELTGNARSLLAGERTALNFLQRLSGIATITSTYVHEISGLRAKVLDTRKTIPGYRELEKQAVRAGGGVNHRMGLYDHFLIKNNHITVAGSVTAAIERAKQARHEGQHIEIETRTLDDVRDAVEAGADIILLDNMSIEQVRDAVELVAGRASLEVSGNIRLDTIRDYAQLGVDFISVGALTHSAPAADIHMLIEIQRS